MLRCILISSLLLLTIGCQVEPYRKRYKVRKNVSELTPSHQLVGILSNAARDLARVEFLLSRRVLKPQDSSAVLQDDGVFTKLLSIVEKEGDSQTITTETATINKYTVRMEDRLHVTIQVNEPHLSPSHFSTSLMIDNKGTIKTFPIVTSTFSDDSQTWKSTLNATELTNFHLALENVRELPTHASLQGEIELTVTPEVRTIFADHLQWELPGLSASTGTVKMQVDPETNETMNATVEGQFEEPKKSRFRASIAEDGRQSWEIEVLE